MRLLIAVLVLPLTYCACGGGGGGGASIEDTKFAPELAVDLSASTKLANGEYIRDLEVGSGVDITSNPAISILYTGWVSDGGVFDTNERDGGVPYTFIYGQKKVIAGLEQGLADMKRGGTRQLIVPPDLAYGQAGALPAVPPNSVVVFKVQLQTETTGSPVSNCGCSTNGGAVTSALAWLGALMLRRRKSCLDGGGRMRLVLISSTVALTSACGISASPAKVQVIEETAFAQALMVDLNASTKLGNGEYIRDLLVGTGAEVQVGQSLNTAYTGWLADGTQFDTGTFSFRYGAGEVIAGWDQGLGGLKVGGTRQLLVPPALGYGARGAGGVIPPNSILVFQVTLR